MEAHHREAIRKSFVNLIKLKNFQKVCDKLISGGIYSDIMLEEVFAAGGSGELKTDRAQRLFLNLPSRGPSAFTCLVETLKSTDNQELAIELVLNSSVPGNGLPEDFKIFPTPRDLLEDEVDSSHSTDFAEYQLIKMRQRSVGSIEGIDELPATNSILKSPLAAAPTSVVEIVESTLSSSAEIEDRSSAGSCRSKLFTPLKTHLPVSPARKYTVKPATVYYNGFPNEGECYKMKSSPRGFALIVNNVDFLGDPDAKRLGGDKDSENLKSVLEQMEYEVTVVTNITKKELLNRDTGTLANFMEKFNKKDVDSCIVSINSHGFDRDWIRMSDPPGRDEKSTAIDLFEDVLQRFNNRNFPIFQGKPKIFLVNACRGSNYNRLVRSPLQNICRTQYDGQSGTRAGSEFSDFLILRSTVPEYVSMRDLENGTWFVQCICQAFSMHACDEEFNTLKRKVNNLMEELIDEDRIKQSCHYEEFGTNKYLYFNPGL